MNCHCCKRKAIYSDKLCKICYNAIILASKSYVNYCKAKNNYILFNYIKHYHVKA